MAKKTDQPSADKSKPKPNKTAGRQIVEPLHKVANPKREILEDWCELKGLSLSRLALAIGTHRDFFSNVWPSSGQKPRSVSIDQAIGIARELNQPLTEVVRVLGYDYPEWAPVIGLVDGNGFVELSGSGNRTPPLREVRDCPVSRPFMKAVIVLAESGVLRPLNGSVLFFEDPETYDLQIRGVLSFIRYADAGAIIGIIGTVYGPDNSLRGDVHGFDGQLVQGGAVIKSVSRVDWLRTRFA